MAEGFPLVHNKEAFEGSPRGPGTTFLFQALGILGTIAKGKSLARSSLLLPVKKPLKKDRGTLTWPLKKDRNLLELGYACEASQPARTRAAARGPTPTVAVVTAIPRESIEKDRGRGLKLSKGVRAN